MVDKSFTKKNPTDNSYEVHFVGLLSARFFFFLQMDNLRSFIHRVIQLI